MIFPEGTRSKDGHLNEGKPGIGVIVAETQCSVIPAYISGTYQVLPMGSARFRLHPVAIHFGEPMAFPSPTSKRSREFYDYVSSTVMTRIAELGRVPYPYKSESHQVASQPSNAEDEAGEIC